MIRVYHKSGAVSRRKMKIFFPELRAFPFWVDKYGILWYNTEKIIFDIFAEEEDEKADYFVDATVSYGFPACCVFN